MVKGIEVFKDYFAGFKDQYVIIGGAACDYHLHTAELIQRTTKDIDIVLIIEAMNPDFVMRFWDFIAAGGYEKKEKGEKRKYYRFLNPTNVDFPFQVELFSRYPSLLDQDERIHVAPIPTPDELSSLSAILMDEAYYQFVIEHSHFANGVHWASIEALLCLKAKAYIDISERIEKGSKDNRRLLKKHKGDILRLGLLLTESEEFYLPAPLYEDFVLFLDQIKEDLPDGAIFKEMGVLATVENVINQIHSSFLQTGR
ncbi:MAG: hypothetical protein R2751_08225 [Bacteroidales bacterium]